MQGSDVRSIQSLQSLCLALHELGHRWDPAIQQVRLAIQRVQEHFAVVLPNYWKQQTHVAEQQLVQALNHLSALEGAKGQAPTEAAQRVRIARKRLAICEAKYRKAINIAASVSHACQELAGPIAEVTAHVETTLPSAATVLKGWVSHLEDYAEVSMRPSESSPLATSMGTGPVGTGRTNSASEIPATENLGEPSPPSTSHE